MRSKEKQSAERGPNAHICFCAAARRKCLKWCSEGQLRRVIHRNFENLVLTKIVKCTPRFDRRDEDLRPFPRSFFDILKWPWLTFLISHAFGQQIDRKYEKTHTNSLKGRTSQRAVLKEFKGECFAPFHLVATLWTRHDRISWCQASAQAWMTWKICNIKFSIRLQRHTSSDRRD